MISLGKYQHFKGNFYQVLHIAKDCETEETLVVYKALYGKKGIWVRALSVFDETIEREGKIIKRFQFIRDE